MTRLDSCLIKYVQRDPGVFDKCHFFFKEVGGPIMYVFPTVNIGQNRSIGWRLPT